MFLIYKYLIGESTYKDYHEIELLHPNKYTEDEFLNICKQALLQTKTKDRKHILNSYGDEGAYFIQDVLIEKYGFRNPDEITCRISMWKVIEGFNVCENCSKVYLFNNKPRCHNLSCENRDMLDEY